MKKYKVNDKVFYKILGATRLEIANGTVVFIIEDKGGTVYGVLDEFGFFIALNHTHTIEPDKYLIHLELASIEEQKAKLDKKMIKLRKEIA